MSFIPTELVCTHKKPDGTPYYAAPRMMWNGRVHVWHSGPDRAAFYRMACGLILKLTGKTVTGADLTWTMADQRTMTALLADYPGTDQADDDIIAELQAIGADVAALDEPPTPPT